MGDSKIEGKRMKPVGMKHQRFWVWERCGNGEGMNGEGRNRFHTRLPLLQLQPPLLLLLPRSPFSLFFSLFGCRLWEKVRIWGFYEPKVWIFFFADRWKLKSLIWSPYILLEGFFVVFFFGILFYLDKFIFIWIKTFLCN